MRNDFLTVCMGIVCGIGPSLAPAQQTGTSTSKRSESRKTEAIVHQFTATFAGGTQATDWIPMDLDLGSYIYVKGMVNGVETDIVLDTGAGATVVDQGFAKKLGLETRRSVMAKGVGGMQRASFLSGIEVELGSLTIQIPEVVGIDMSGVAASLGRDMPVILGKDVFRELVVDLDYPGSRLALSAPASFKYGGPGHTIPLFRGEGGHRLVELGIEGLRPAKFTLDTGSGSTIDLFKAFSDENGLLEGRSPVSTRQAGGVGGHIVSKVATLRSVTFAGYKLANVPAGFTQEDKGGAFDDDSIAGNLGAGIFSRFRMILDYSRAELHVEPCADWATRPFHKDRVGLDGLFEDGAIKVTHVAKDSPAEKQGWKIGERIRAVDGKPVSAANWRTEMVKWTQSPAGTEVVLADAEGRVRKLVAADYY